MLENQNSVDYIEITDDLIVKNDSQLAREKQGDIESAFSYANPFFLTIAMICTVVFLIQIASGLFELGDTIVPDNFTFKYSNYEQGGNPWGILTSIFLHGSIDHIIGNLIMLYVLSLVLYRVIGFLASMWVFLVTGALAGIVSYFLGDVPSIGASGAVFGVFGFVSVFYLLERKKLSINLEDLSWVMILSAAIQIISGFFRPYIDNYAHIGGFIAGCIIGYAYLKIYPVERI